MYLKRAGTEKGKRRVSIKERRALREG